MADKKKLEDIKTDKKLSILSYPLKILPSYSNFLLGKYDFWHNGIHINSKEALQSIYDAQVVAYRFIKNYKHRNFDIDNAKFPSSYINNLWESTAYSKIDKLFIKDENGFYKLKENATEKDKEKAYRFINKLYSNSFILLRHNIKNSDNKEISFYSLYNHLKPFARMTLEQKLSLCFYFSKAEMQINSMPYSAYCKFFDILRQKDVLLPAELPLSKDNNEKSYIKWEINKNKYEALIDSRLLRTFKDNHVEIKRPGNDKNLYLTNKTDYVSSKTVLVLFDSGDRGNRLAKQFFYFQVYDKRDKIFEINSTDLVSWFDNKEDVGLRIRYKNDYLYIYPKNKKELKEAYKILDKVEIYKNRDSSAPVSIFCSIEQGIVLKIFFYNGKDKFYFKAPKTKQIVNIEYETNYIQLKDVYLIESENKSSVAIPYNIIPCETKVTVTSNYTASFNGSEYHGFIDSQYVDVNQMKIKKASMGDGSGLTWKWKNDCILIYDSGDIEKRKVIDTIRNSGPFELSDKKDLLRFRAESEGKEKQLFSQFEKGLSVKYKRSVPDVHINSQYNGFIYLSFQNNTGIAYEMETNKKNFIADISKWLTSVDEEGPGLVKKNSSGVTVSLYKDTEYKIDDNINFPVEKTIKKDDVIGYTGYSVADEDDNTKNSNEDATSMHFEIFTNDKTFMNSFPPADFDIEKKRFPCYCKINSECTAYQGKILTICGSTMDNFVNPVQTKKSRFSSVLKNTVTKIKPGVIKSALSFVAKNVFKLDLDFDTPGAFSKYENICYEETEKGFLTEGQNYSCLKPVARIIPMEENEYFRRSDIEWNGENRFYYINKTTEVQVYNNKNEAIEGKKIKLYKDLRYLESASYSEYEESIKDDKSYKIVGPGEFDFLEADETLKGDELKLRRPGFYLEKITADNEPVYIKTSDLSEFEYRDAKGARRYYFFYGGKKLNAEKLVQKPCGTCWNSQESGYSEIILKKDDSKNYQFCYEFMHEYDGLGEKHKTLKTWCKIKADAGTEYWVNKDDFDFKSKDGSNIGVVFYDRWDDFFEEIKLDKYGTYKCEKEKQKAFIKDYKLKELGINSVQNIPSNSKDIKKFYYNAESEWSDNQKITDEYVNLSPIQKKETTEYRKDLAFITDTFVNALSKQKFSKKNYYFNPVAFLNHLDKVATPAEFNPYLGKRYAEIYSDKTAPNIDLNTFVKDTPGFAPRWEKGWWSADSNPNTDGYSAVNGFFNHIYTKVSPKYYHEGIDFRGPEKTEIVSFINAKVIAYGWMTDSNGSIYGSGYGQTIFLYDTQNKGIYQLSHLYEFDKGIYVGKQYHPGDVVAKVGNSGHGLVNDNDHWSAHLHLSYYDIMYSQIIEKFVYTEGNSIKRTKKFNTVWATLRNPFDHNSSEKHGGFNK